jgi:dipeptidyl-peptidase-4
MTAPLTLADLSRLPHPGMDAPARISFTPSGDGLIFLHAADGSLVRSLWHHDLSTGQRRLVAAPPPESTREETLTDAERLRRQRTRTEELGVTDYAWAADAPVPTLMVPMAGQIHLAVGAPNAGVRPLEGVEGITATAISPDGSHVACVRDDDIWVVPVAGGKPRRLTDDAEPHVFNGRAEYIAAEELDRLDGMWWSADGRRIAYAHVDERGVPPHAIARLATAAGGYEVHRYAFTGGPNARVELWIVDVDGGSPTRVDLPMAVDDYLARVMPHPAGGWLAAVLPRDQRSLRWVSVSPDGASRELWVETADPWLNLDDDTRVMRDGRILRTTEDSGFRHIELREADGSPGGRLTEGPWVVVEVVHVDEPRDEVLFIATCDDVTERHLYRVRLDTDRPVQRPERLTAEPGCHSAVFSRDGGRWVDRWSSLEAAPAVVVRHRDGGAPLEVHSATATAASLGLTPPSLIEVPADDGETTLCGLRYSAAAAPPPPATAMPPPCVVWVYGGPRSEYACRSWESTVNPLLQYFATHGAVVLVVDNRGTYFRGLAFEAALQDRMGTVEVADQVAAVRELAQRGEIDIGRVGIMGGSYGGYLTLLAMAHAPEIFRTGVAIAPVTSWEGYDTAYTERYMGLPAYNADGYRTAAPLTHAAAILGDLLLIHGVLDENVHLSHSVQLQASLQAAGRDVELLLLPDQRHRLRGQAPIRLRERRTVAHLLRGLGLPLPDELLPRRDTL